MPEPSIETVISRMAFSGLSSSFIAFALESPETQVQAVLAAQNHRQVPVMVDEDMVSEIRALASTCLREARKVMEFGPNPDKMAIMKIMLSSLVKQTGASDKQSKEARAQLEQLFGVMRDVKHEARDSAATTPAYINTNSFDAESETVTLPTDDQDQDARLP